MIVVFGGSLRVGIPRRIQRQVYCLFFKLIYVKRHTVAQDNKRATTENKIFDIIFFTPSGIEVKRGVEFYYSILNASKIR